MEEFVPQEELEGAQEEELGLGVEIPAETIIRIFRQVEMV